MTYAEWRGWTTEVERLKRWGGERRRVDKGRCGGRATWRRRGRHICTIFWSSKSHFFRDGWEYAYSGMNVWRYMGGGGSVKVQYSACAAVKGPPPHHETASASTTCFACLPCRPPRPFNTADTNIQYLIARHFLAPDGMIHLVLHAVSSRGGSGTSTKGMMR